MSSPRQTLRPLAPASRPACARPRSTPPSRPPPPPVAAFAPTPRRSRPPPAARAAPGRGRRRRSRVLQQLQVAASPHPAHGSAPSRKTPRCPGSARAETAPSAPGTRPSCETAARPVSSGTQDSHTRTDAPSTAPAPVLSCGSAIRSILRSRGNRGSSPPRRCRSRCPAAPAPR